MNLTQNDLLNLEQQVSDLLIHFGNILSQEWKHTQVVSLKEQRKFGFR